MHLNCDFLQIKNVKFMSNLRQILQLNKKTNSICLIVKINSKFKYTIQKSFILRCREKLIFLQNAKIKKQVMCTICSSLMCKEI